MLRKLLKNFWDRLIKVDISFYGVGWWKFIYREYHKIIRIGSNHISTAIVECRAGLKLC